jgi:alkyl sulfatase BDS1-like metallo-beta-lactamase superfamily hydrolase
MAALGPELLLPGHGFPIRGATRIQQALTETAELLETLHEQTLALMNAGATLDDVLHTVRAPEHLLARPYLRPVYDEPEFIVRNIWRRYGGWYDGNPAHLKPAPEAALAGEIATLAGGAARLAERATTLAEAGELALACHLAELAVRAAPGDAGIRAARAAVYKRRAAAETSLMARSIYRAACDDGE